MKIAAIGALAILLATMGSARADDIQTAYLAVNVLLQRSDGGLVSRKSLCPKKHRSTEGRWEFASSATVVSINDSDSAVLVDTGECYGGNGSGQYLVIIQNDAASVVTDAGIEDMSFLADHMYAEDDSLFLYGDQWLTTDAHCCPSKKATLEYNLKTHQHTLTTAGDNKP
jgi:hypothetical protein